MPETLVEEIGRLAFAIGEELRTVKDSSGSGGTTTELPIYFYTSPTDIGLSTSSSISEVFAAMPDYSVMWTSPDKMSGSSYPHTYASILLLRGSGSCRGGIYLIGKSETNYDYRMYLTSDCPATEEWILYGANAKRWDGAAKTVSSSSASGGSNGDIHYQYIS